MKISDYIRRSKEKFKETKTKFHQLKQGRQVRRLQSLREKRINLESSASLKCYENKERARIEKAEGTLNKGKGAGIFGKLRQNQTVIKGKGNKDVKSNLLDRTGSNSYRLEKVSKANWGGNGNLPNLGMGSHNPNMGLIATKSTANIWGLKNNSRYKRKR